MDCSHGMDGIPQIYGATAFTAAFRQFSRTSPHDFTWEIIPSHFEIDRGPIEKTAIFRRLKAERCNCRFRHESIADDSFRSSRKPVLTLAQLLVDRISGERKRERERKERQWSLVFRSDSIIKIRSIEV